MGGKAVEIHHDVRAEEGERPLRFRGEVLCRKCSRPTCKQKPFCSGCLENLPYAARVMRWVRLYGRKREEAAE